MSDLVLYILYEETIFYSLSFSTDCAAKTRARFLPLPSSVFGLRSEVLPAPLLILIVEFVVGEVVAASEFF
ncbi:hypothetical protein QUB69_36185 [Microcoleus sp. AT13-A6]|uniref:hypothetical protein n=1 Tax=unclassified Microcoleus TaxID=2642155 RepID=UPI002FD438D1